jgi:hypothetical protein
MIIANNTVANCGEGGFEIGNDGAASPTSNDLSTIINNISVNNLGPYGGFRESGNTGAHNVYLNNLVYGNPAGDFLLQSGLSAAGTQTGSNSTTFVSYTGTGAGDYHLKSGSTAINHGTDICASGVSNCVPLTDFDGNTLPPGGPWSIGAFMPAGATSQVPPPTRLTVTVE